ncbi:MAG TPA: permease prefix domain 1-containing protein [Actinocatenispora sp.]
MTNDVDRYLDRLFDRLAGTGSAGRRALVEVEDHLHAAVAERVDGGMSPDAAEHAALTAFGDVRMVARKLRAGHRRERIVVAASGVWLSGGLACAVAALSFLLTLADRWWVWSRGPSWGDCVGGLPCDPAGQSPYLLGIGLSFAVVATLLLVGRGLLRRRARLAPSGRRLPVLLAAVCAVLTPAMLTSLGDPFAVNDAIVGAAGPGLFLTVVASSVTAVATVAAVVWAGLRHRRLAGA